ncbi:MAG TPA: NADH-quinone oxidoreductase subunit NuoE [Bacillota bacterium]|jgi:NADH-quinone oxidoreductase subunit E|nr:NADH-quinone oxidoreductase subunit NuoE [Bacillota bacterium]HNU94668.1 NADH-quinone oxidoreductase subunit NuoE [Bacillota bacterium]HNY68513.1 NADH-quinone oxidoreductase subunit NuoE [Bacillota bacterium]HOI36810.1 NADH-quinone oxidoreductase subunit NuoE [Bacillota bacterium]HPU75445.1 NADH-quinone oxidoreductase subunit NuoE [Bacillota bacterium]
MTPVELAQRKFERVNEIIEEHGREQSALIPILQEVQAEYRYLPEEILTYIATAMGLSAATVFGVATFYAQFSLEPKGKYVVRVCDGTACHVRHSMLVYQAIRSKLELKDGKFTTPDMMFTVETVACLGACGVAPAMVVNGEVYGKMTPEAACTIIDMLLYRDGDN